MGAFFTNYQIRATASKVKKALEKVVDARAYISPEKNGWVTVYDESSDEQNEAIITRVAAALSKSLKTDVLAFLVHDSDVAMYWLYQAGAIKDEFNSAPDYFDEDIDDETRARFRGNPEALLPLCIPGTTREDIEAVIHPADGLPLMAEGVFSDLAKLLGMDDARVALGFKYFDEEGDDLLPDAADFEPVGQQTKQKKVRPPKPIEPAAVAIPDMFPVAIGMLTQCWSGKHEKYLQAVGPMLAATGQKVESEKMLKQLRDGFDRGARDFLKHSTSPDRPSLEELKTARDQGPEALAKLLATRTPKMFADIAANAIHEGLEQFIAALLAEGLDPNSKDHHGNTVLSHAEKLGPDSPIYRLLKSAAEKKQ